MAMTSQAPTSPVATFTLSPDGSYVRKPWSRTRAIPGALARPSWTEREKNQIRKIGDWFWGFPDDSEEFRLVGQIRSAVKEWDRINQAPDRLEWM